jgi:hypothetical protein
MTDKDHDKDKHEADKRAAADKAPKHFDNPNQDPNHPSNKTPAKDPKAPGPDHIPGAVYAAENLMTEQEKDAAKNAPGSSAKQPYPTGDPPPIVETVTYSQGIKGADQPSAKPGVSSGPAGKAPEPGDKPKKET